MRATAAAALLALAACEDSTAPGPGSVDAALAVQLQQLAGTAAASGDYTRAGALSVAAGAVAAGIPLTTLTITDGATTDEYKAIVMDVSPVFPPTSSFALPSTRQLVAWRGEAADRMLHLSVHGDRATFGTPTFGTGPTPQFAVGSFTSGPGEVWAASAGSATVTLKSTGGACPAAPRPPGARPLPPSYTCSTATFDASFDVTFTPAPVLGPRAPTTPPTGTRRLTMSARPIAGSRVTIACTMARDMVTCG